MEDKEVELTKDQIIGNQEKVQQLESENGLLATQVKEAQEEAARLKEELRQASYEIRRLKEAIVNRFLSKWEE